MITQAYLSSAPDTKFVSLMRAIQSTEHLKIEDFFLFDFKTVQETRVELSMKVIKIPAKNNVSKGIYR